jgi:uncharacterized membrane protein
MCPTQHLKVLVCIYMRQVLILALIFLAIDYLWVGIISRQMWSDNVLAIQNSPLKVNMVYAALSYVLLIAGLYIFIIERGAPLWQAAFYGLVVYGVFDFTNMAIFQHYSLSTGILDMLWGAVVCGAVTFVFRSL